ncbi:glycoside hydrolase family 30 protein [Microbacterium hominis]|uniref:glycoside hydrolase family 30 protein n=1 Tax=Microbacterium hominis TaxID=162426 RepID=UPI0007688784|nr:glycoside hydrolase family 30 protein [Microbacterium hominis]KXC06590.1 beta-glycosidase [Microbacterium hominis]
MNATTWTVTTPEEPWRAAPPPVLAAPTAMPDVIVAVDDPQQEIDGFGACFNELGWAALGLLTAQERDGILRELFAPGVGASFGLCRMPVGANDFSLDWYSYDETPGDLALAHFDASHDDETLVPFIRAARAHRPDLRLWASPWSPPTWMKRNGHYAGAMPHPFFGDVDNGLRPEQVGAEGTDMFRTDEEHLRAYAAYFGRFVDAYAERGIPISMVMPQNEFNSPQVFPSCTWTPAGLAALLRHLGPQMAARGVEVYLGTLERADDRLVGAVLADDAAPAVVSGIGVQWAGKGAVAALHRLHPDLRIVQTEQECGDGRNDWRQARYAWRLMKHFLGNGANAYQYWNIALPEGGRSRWGWTQNSLVVVDPQRRTFRYTPDYLVLKHVAAFVRPGARVLPTWCVAGHDNQLVFRNPDGSVVVVLHNELAEPLPISLLLGERVLSLELPAASFSTVVIPA